MTDTQFPCGQCGASLTFKPGVQALVCEYCGHENAVGTTETGVEELDYTEALERASRGAEEVEQTTVKCDGCGAESTLDPNIASDECPFCGTPIVSGAAKRKVFKARSLLPFKVPKKKAGDAFTTWRRKLWFAPNKLKRQGQNRRPLQGVYLPYWTYDTRTVSDYTGERGEHYMVSESYTTTENGKTVSKTRMVQRTRWYPASGRVSNTFDDVLVVASPSLPRKLTEALEPWDLAALVPYQDDYLSGFRTETYQVGLKEGFAEAKTKMDPEIRSTIRRHIGGDTQRIHHLSTKYGDISFKHILLPLWISSYRFKEKIYRFLINARTGEVQGQRPYSWVKITCAIIAAAAVIGPIIGALVYYGD